jgi:hypothetical protein
MNRTEAEKPKKSIFARLQSCRVELAEMHLEKGGENKFAGYKYFELADFLPSVNRLFEKYNLCGVTTFTKEDAKLTIYDTDGTGETIVFSSPMAEANLKGAHPIQNMGAVQTYQRRYLYMAALEITEPDALDASKPQEAAKPQAKKPMDAATWERLVTSLNAGERKTKTGTNLIEWVKSTFEISVDQQITIESYQ